MIFKKEVFFLVELISFLLLLYSVAITGGQVEKDEDSPFGIYGAYNIEGNRQYLKSNVTNHLINIGAKWILAAAPELREVGKELSTKDINILARVGRETEESLRKMVSRHKNRIKYWQVLEEEDGHGRYRFRPDLYVKLLQSVYKTVKDEDKEASIVLGALEGNLKAKRKQGPEYLRAILRCGAGKYFDILAFNFEGYAGDYLQLKNTISTYKGILKEYGFTDKPIWITATATHDDDPIAPSFSKRPDPPYQSETSQAAELLKRFVFGLSLGVKKIFWNSMVEHHNFGGISNTYFDHVGLINNRANDGKSYEKLAYYTYKLMVEKLEGSDWDNVQVIQEKGGIHIYKFIKQGSFVWVAWNDNKTMQNIKIPGVGASRSKVTYAIPKVGSGGMVKNYRNAFESKVLEVHQRKLSLDLVSNRPLFIEED